MKKGSQKISVFYPDYLVNIYRLRALQATPINFESYIYEFTRRFNTFSSLSTPFGPERMDCIFKTQCQRQRFGRLMTGVKLCTSGIGVIGFIRPLELARNVTGEGNHM